MSVTYIYELWYISATTENCRITRFINSNFAGIFTNRSRLDLNSPDISKKIPLDRKSPGYSHAHKVSHRKINPNSRNSLKIPFTVLQIIERSDNSKIKVSHSKDKFTKCEIYHKHAMDYIINFQN